MRTAHPLRIIGGTLLVTAFAASALAVHTVQQPKKPWFPPARASRATNPLPANAQTLALGKQVFTQHCVACHGERGRGDGPSGTQLEVQPGDLTRAYNWVDTDGALFWKITKGRAPMTAFETLTTEEERWAAVAYARTFSKEPTHTRASNPLGNGARSAISDAIAEYDRLRMSWITQSQSFITRQKERLGTKLDALAQIQDNSLTGNLSEQWSTLIATARKDLKLFSELSTGSPEAVDALVRLSASLVKIVEIFGHDDDRAVAILEAGSNVWLQTSGPAWSPFGDDRDLIRIRSFVDAGAD